MKFLLSLIAIAACGTALAQAPAGMGQRPSQETNPVASGGKAAAKAEMNKDAKVAATSMAGTSMGANRAMDTNGDGFISRKEWNSYHSAMWRGMKADKRGRVPWADVDAKLKGGPN